MRKTFKTVLVSVLAGVFTLGSVLCCCVRNIAHAGITAQKTHACCASKHTAGHSQKAADCEHCSVKPMQTAQSFELTPSFTIAFNLLPADIVFMTHTAVVYQTVWADGPPGFSSEVPLYIQSHQIRV